jgi:hypothetical protein
MVCVWFGLKTTGTVSPGLASKPVVTISPGLASKLVAPVSWFGPQNWQLWFANLGLKVTAMVSWFEPQNQAGFGLLVAPQTDGVRTARDTRRDLVACFA